MKNKNNIFNSPQLVASMPQSTPVLLAYSGGADSSALLHLLYDDSIKNGYKLYAAHFNHQIRGEEAKRDEDFCKRICEELQVPLYVGNADIPSLAKENGNSIESEAREQRYAFFEKIMRENDIPILVTAHHSEDQIESIMLHLLRGSGLSGLCGILPCREISEGLLLVRPILNVQKEEILSYCEKNNISFVTDSTNSDTGYARNFLRAEVTPNMRKLQPNLSKVFERLSESACEANDFIDSSAKEFISNECKNGIPLYQFNELHNALKPRVLILEFERHCANASLESTHIKSIIELCAKAEPHSSISLPNQFAAKIEQNTLIFTKDKEENSDEEFILSFTTGIIPLSNGLTITVEQNPTQKPLDNDIFLDVKCDMINHSAHFRSKKEGDVIFSGKMNKKAKKLINEKKIPLDKRSKLPLLIVENKILWIPLVAVCDEIKKDKINFGDNFYRITVNFEN